MTATANLSKATFEQLQKLDTCVVSNAIEKFRVRLRNEGSIPGSAVRCMFPNFPPMLGYAVTGRMRSTLAPVVGPNYYENMEWWRYVASIPGPRVMVVQDADERPGSGALIGDLHAAIGLALNCVGYVTNGSVRDVPGVEALGGFQLFAGSVAVSHMYAHISSYGEPVEIGGVKIAPGDLIHGDRHGVHIIPQSIAADIPAVAAQIIADEARIKEYCRSPQFSLDGLEDRFRHKHAAEVANDGH